MTARQYRTTCTTSTTAGLARRLRTGMALAAGAALLGLSACGAADTGAETPSAGGSSAQEQTTAPSAGAEESADGSDEDTGSAEDSGSATDGAADEQDGAGADEGAGDEGDGQDSGASGDRTRILLVTDLGITEEEDTTGDGPIVLENDRLAALLGDPFGSTVECAEPLTLETGSTSGCVGPTSLDDTAPTQEWVASAVYVPHEDGFEHGYRSAVLFSTGVELPARASALTQGNVSLTGVGMGSMFGAEPLSVEELEEATFQTLTSDNAYVPVADMADWTGVTCEDGMDFDDFATVDCTAELADGGYWQLHVAPGTFADNDQGLLVGIGSPGDL